MRIRTEPAKILLPPTQAGKGRGRWRRRHIAAGDGVPPSLAGVSHAVAVGPLCHTGGQLAIDAEGHLRDGSAEEQADLAFRNLIAVLKAAGFSKRDVVFVDIALAAMDDLAAVNGVFHGVFARMPRPARAVLQAAALPLGAKVRVHALAIKNGVGAAE